MGGTPQIGLLPNQIPLKGRYGSSVSLRFAFQGVELHGYRLLTVGPGPPSLVSACVSVSCRPTEAHAGPGLRREDLGQRGSVPSVLLTVPRPRRRARGPAL